MTHLDTQQPHRTREEQLAYGKSLRQTVKRSSHATWQVTKNRTQILDLLALQDHDCLPHLLPVKYGRMLESPFAYFRGSAVVMASDLSQTPATGLAVLLCGDAHLANFGLFASPERNLVFDINDFDECYPGSWEWDLKRLAASVVVAGRVQNFGDDRLRDIVTGMSRMYREAIRRMDRWSTLDVWYHYVDAVFLENMYDEWANRKSLKSLRKTIEKAESRTQNQIVKQMTTRTDGTLQFKSEPPLLVPLRGNLLEEHHLKDHLLATSTETMRDQWHAYLASLDDDQRFLLSRYQMVDVALRVGGTGSTGTRTFIVLLQGEGKEDYLLLQLKQARKSALAAYLPAQPYANPAKRIVIGQRRIQATPDIFLGWHQDSSHGHHYYWRQFKDMKTSLDLDKMDTHGFETYAHACALVLARAHARTGDEAAIRGYVGKSENFDKAIAEFALAYADQTEADYQVLVQAIRDGKIAAETGV